MERQIKSRGVGVTEQAQRLFDNLTKTMPCQWEATSIEVFDSVTITAPYTIETCTYKDGAEENATIMERVQVPPPTSRTCKPVDMCCVSCCCSGRWGSSRCTFLQGCRHAAVASMCPLSSEGRGSPSLFDEEVSAYQCAYCTLINFSRGFLMSTGFSRLPSLYSRSRSLYSG